jgi:hypothetical protein
MHLIEVDAVGPQTAERFLDLLLNAPRRGVAEDFFALPGQAAFGSDQHAVAPVARLQGAPDDLFRPPETVNGRGVDQRDAAIDSGIDRPQSAARIRAAPHPAADRPGAERDARRHQAGGPDFDGFHDRIRTHGSLLEDFGPSHAHSRHSLGRGSCRLRWM